MYPTRVEQLQARVTALEAIVASLVEALASGDRTGADVGGRIYGNAAEALRGKLDGAAASDVAFTHRALDIVRSALPTHAL